MSALISFTFEVEVDDNPEGIRFVRVFSTRRDAAKIAATCTYQGKPATVKMVRNDYRPRIR